MSLFARYLKNLRLLMCIALFCHSGMNAADCCTLKSPDTDVSGIVRFQLTPAFYECDYAYSFLGELGPENYRANITYAWNAGALLRYKLTGEYLSQRHNFRFLNSSQNEWTHQTAFGGAAQLCCCVGFLHTLELAGDYSYAYRKNLSHEYHEEQLLRRRVGGSEAYNIRGGATISTPYNGFLSGWIGYDFFNDKCQYQSNKKIEGVAGGFYFEQPVWNAILLNLHADFKQPYHFYELQANWEGIVCGGCWKMGGFANYTDGRNGLNNDGKFGVQLSYSFGSGGECSSEECRQACYTCSLEQWTSVPAVYRPVTLSVRDQDIPDCIAPEVVGMPPTGLGITLNSTIPPFDFSEFFLGTNLKYVASNLPPSLVIDKNSGVITGTTTQAGSFPTTITASNCCGTVTISVQITVSGPI